MSFKGTVVFKKKDQLLPEAYLKVLLDKHASYVSITMLDKKEFDINDLAPISMSDFKEAQELRKQDEVIFFFADQKADLPEEIYSQVAQPFCVLKDGKNNPLLLAYTDGDFSNHHKEKSTLSDDFFMIQEYFQPRISRWYSKGGNDLKAVLAELNDPVTQEDIRNSFMGRGNVVFFFLTGEVVLVQKGNEAFKEYPWGYTTNRFDYIEGSAKTSVLEVASGPTKRRVMNKQSDLEPKEASPKTGETFSGKAAETQPTAGKGTTSPAKEKETKQADTVSDADKEGVGGPNLIEIQFKPNIPLGATKEQRREIYNQIPKMNVWRKKASPLKFPDSYNKGAAVIMTVKQSELAEYIALGWEPRNSSVRVTSNGKKETQQEPLATKDTAAHNLPAPEDQPGYKPFSPDQSDMEATGLLGKDKTIPVKKFFAEATANKFIGTDSQVIALDPKTIQSMENKVPTASQQIGLEFEHILRLSRTGLLALCKSHPEWFTELYIEVAGYYISSLKKDDRPTSQDHVEEVEAAPITQAAPAEEVVLGPVRRRKVA